MPIISTAEYKAYADITDSGWDTRIGVLISVAQETLEDYCGRVFDEAVYVDAKFSGNGEQSLWIKNIPLTAVSAVKTVDSAGVATTLDADNYRFTENGQLFRLGGLDAHWNRQPAMYPDDRRGAVWADDAPDNVLVSYTGGYATVPNSLKGLMYILVDGLIDEAGENWKLASSGDGVISRAALAPDLITRRYADLCRPWRGSGLAVV